MTSWNAGWRFPLYLRVWLAVIVAVGVITLAFGWLMRLSFEQQQPPPREVVVRNERDEVIGQGLVRPNRVRGQGFEFEVPMNDGRTITVQLPPRPRPPPGELGRLWPPRGSNGFFWMLGLVAIAVALGSYPVVRRLTQENPRQLLPRNLVPSPGTPGEG